MLPLLLALLPSIQDPQSDFARDALAAVAAGDDELLRAMSREVPHRARPLVHELLWEALRAGQGRSPALAAARRIAEACATAGAGADLLSYVDAVAGLDEHARSAQRDFDAAFFPASEAARRGDWTAARPLAQAAVEHARAAGLPYLELRARRLLAEALRSAGDGQGFRQEMLAVLELERALELSLEGLADLEELARTERSEGRLGDANAHLAEAESLARSIGDERRADSLLAERGAVLTGLGLFAPAYEALTRALAFLEERPDAALETRTLLFLGALASAAGRYGESIQRLREARRAAHAARDPPGEVRAVIQLAGVYSELGLTSEAEDTLSAALEEIEQHDLSSERGPALLARGLLELDAARPAASLAVLDELLALPGLADPARSAAERQRGAALLALARASEAGQALRRSLELGSADPLARSWCRTTLGDALWHQGLQDEAESEYRRALEEAAEVTSQEGSWRARLGLGRVLESRGRAEEALAHYARALVEVEALRASLGAPLLRAAWLGNCLELYRRSARLLARAGRLDEAFRTAEAAKSRTLLELCRPHPADPPRPALPRVAAARGRLEQARSDMRLLDLELASLPRTPAAAETRADLEVRLRQARAEHEAARIELELADPRGTLLLGLADAPSLDRTRELLRADELLLHYLVGPEGTVLFAVHRDGARLIELPASEAELGERIQRILRPIELLREGRIDLATLGFDARAAQELHDLLLGPVRDELARCRTLWIVPDGPLRRLPFGLLVSAREKRPVDPGRLFAQYSGCRFLIEDCAPAILPSAGLLAASEEGGPHELELLAVADPRPRLPGAAELAWSRAEAKAVARSRSPAELLLGEAALEELVKSLAPRARVLHFATHAVLDDRRPGFSRLALAPGGDQDGWLHAHEVEGLRLSARLVLLSACETLGSAGRGEGLLGLSRAFLAAGAQAVVATAWPVEDRASAELMGRYLEALLEEEPIAALRTAQIGLLRSGGREGVLYSHPYFWGGFLHVGQR